MLDRIIQIIPSLKMSDPHEVRVPHGLVIGGKSTIWLFIHGYNTGIEAAQRSFEQLLEPITRRYRIDDEALVLVTWKGYYDPFEPGQPWKPLSGPSYPLQLRSAQRAGAGLATFLRAFADGQHGPPGRIVVVAHSLGCRMLLEALNMLTNRRLFPYSPVAEIMLIAAAVPTHLLDYSRDLWYAVLAPPKRTALCSRADAVLRWIFPLGEAAGGDGLFPTAVGWSGEPVTMLTARVWRTCGHSDYFSDTVTRDYVAEALNCPVPRRLRTHNAQHYEIEAPRTLPERILRAITPRPRKPMMHA